MSGYEQIECRGRDKYEWSIHCGGFTVDPRSVRASLSEYTMTMFPKWERIENRKKDWPKSKVVPGGKLWDRREQIMIWTRGLQQGLDQRDIKEFQRRDITWIHHVGIQADRVSGTRQIWMEYTLRGFHTLKFLRRSERYTVLSNQVTFLEVAGVVIERN